MLTSNRHLGSETTAEPFAFLKARAVASGVRLEQADIDACDALQKQLFQFLGWRRLQWPMQLSVLMSSSA
jgi:ABC-type amino acid transport substrate-binding protein